MSTPETASAPDSDRRPRLSLAVVLGLAFVLRLASLIADSQLPLFRHMRLDSQIYDEAGRAIAAGDWTLGHEVFHMSPGYSYFVGLVYAVFGTGPWALRLVQFALGLVTVAALYGAARRLFEERWAFITGIAAAVYGPFIFYDVQVLADGLMTTLMAVLLWLLVRSREAGLRSWLATGLVWGLAVITRPNALLLLAPIALAAWFSSQRLKGLAIALLGGALCIAPVTLRNILVSGERVLITDNGGMNFFIGNGPDSAGTFHAPPGMPNADNPKAQFPAYRAAAERALGHPVSFREADAYWMHQTLQYIRQHPGTWLRLMVEKLWLFWSAREIPNTEDYSFIRTLNPVLGLPLLQFGFIAPFAFVGSLLLLFRRRREESLVGLINVVLCVANVMVFILARYRVAAVPGLLLAAAGCAQWLAELVERREWRPVGAVAAAFVPLAVLVWTPKLPGPFDGQYFKLGYAYQVQNDLQGAEWAYLKSIEINRDNISAQKNLAFMYEQTGHVEAARQRWTEVARIAAATSRAEYARDAKSHLEFLNGQGAPPASGTTAGVRP